MRKIKRGRFQISLKMKLWAFGILLLAICVGAFFVSEPGKKTIAWVRGVCDITMEKARLNLDQVTVIGRERTSLSDINNAVNLQQGTPIFDVNLNQIQEQILMLPWIKSVTVERRLPDTIFIHIVEKTPIAVWQHQKKYLPIDQDGIPVQDSKNLPSDVLLIVGKDAPKHFVSLMDALKQFPDILGIVRSAVRVGDRRWSLMLFDAEKGIEVLLPEKDTVAALQRLDERNRVENILQMDLEKIDLRLDDRTILHAKTPMKTVKKKGK